MLFLLVINARLREKIMHATERVREGEGSEINRGG